MKKYEEKREESITKRIGYREPINTRVYLEDLALRGFKEKLVEMLKEELDEYIGREKFERGESTVKYRNGYGKERKITIGSGTARIRVPRTRDGFRSAIIKPYQRRSENVDEMILDLYLHGISTGDFNRFLDKMLGEEAALSSKTIQRMKKRWEQEYKEWQDRKLDSEYLYIWADGIYPKAGPKDDRMALLVLIGIRKNGDKDILTLSEGYRESYESWKDTFKDIKRRGVKNIGLLVGDGIKGLWKAVSEIFPQTDHQRCWVHKMRNVLDKVPTKVQEEVKEELRDIYNSRNKREAECLIADFRNKYYSKYPNAVISLEEGGNKLLTYFKYPKQHWKSIKTTNPIESCFATVKLRTNAARRIRTRDSAVYLIYKILTESQKRWRKINCHKLVKITLEKLFGKVNNIAA
jgi:putative transposase